MDEYYALKKINKQQAWQLIQHIIQQYPHNLTALKEGGFLAIEEHQPKLAIRYFTEAYQMTFAPDLAMQLGYLHSEMTHNFQAYRYFQLATRSTDADLALKAQNALTNMAGLQLKTFPEPYFSEFFFDPFSQSRFGLTVRPLVARFGLEFQNKLQTKVYYVFRQTEDNKSLNLGQVPQIYEDNVRIIGGGIQVTPISSIPMIAFVEAGEGYDLVYRNRKRLRGDLRGGLMYFQQFGAMPAYFAKPKTSTDYYSFLYGDITYFSRYNNNVIGTFRTHQGIRLLQYHTTMLNVYGAARLIEDTNRDFFNNIFELGPGVGLIPNNRYNVEIRFEHLNGVYLPAGGSFNPYGKYYTNNIVQLLMYAKL